MQIFLSHTEADKPVVEPVALRLREIYSQDNVFYDAWSIQPGEGILQRMNEGLEAPDFVFFFVSAASLASKMVEIEWQNALYTSTKGKIRIVPVRVDGSEMPPLLRQSLWIDMFANGIEAAIQQIVNVVQGQNTFTPQHLGFSNLTFSVVSQTDNKVTIKISASHLMEPNPSFQILFDNEEDEFKVDLSNRQPFKGGFTKQAGTFNDKVVNSFGVTPLGGAITPKHPLMIDIERAGDVPVRICGVLHQAGYDEWRTVPAK